MGFKIDKFIRKDTDRVQEICKENMKDYFVKYYESGWSDEVNKNYCSNFLNEGGTIYTLRFNSKVIGVIMIKIQGKCLYISELQLNSNYQGKGYGTECLLFVEKLARDFNCSCIELSVFLQNPAKKLYEKFGFTMIEHKSTHQILMRKELSK